MKIVSINHTSAFDIRKMLTLSAVEYLNTLKFNVRFNAENYTWALVGTDALGGILITCSGEGYDDDSFGVIFMESKCSTRPYSIRPIPDLDGNYTEGIEIAPAYFDEDEPAKAFQTWDVGEWVKLTPSQEIEYQSDLTLEDREPDEDEPDEDQEDEDEN